MIQLIDVNTTMCEAWSEFFGAENDVKIHCGDFFSLPSDCIVSPANSFGFMDGGLDKIICDNIGQQIESIIQYDITHKYNGELLVGQAFLAETGYENIPLCICAPTMRYPQRIDGTVNVYLAAKAIFRIFKEKDTVLKFDTITISGLGTGTGRVPEYRCAKQMYEAYKEVILDKQRNFKTLHEYRKFSEYLML